MGGWGEREREEEKEEEGAFQGWEELPVGGLFAVTGDGGVFQFAVGSGVTGFVFGVTEVGKAFQRVVEEVG